jgi:hypothetical protein
MTRAFLIVALLFGGAFASGGDTLRWPVDLRNVQDGDTFFVSRHIAPLRDSTQSVINGRLGNVNIATNANIGQDKIDSTGTGWLYRYGKKFTKWSGELLSFRSSRGINVFVNDTTANSQPFSIISDSSDTVAKFSESGVVLKKGLNATTGSFSGDVSGDDFDLDSVTCTKVNSGQGWTEIYPQDQNLRTTDGPTFTGATLSGLTASRLTATNASKGLASVPTLSSWIAGTANRITATDNGSGGLTLNLPQDIHTGASPAFAQLNIDNLRLDANTLSSTNTNGDINLEPDGTGSVVTTKALSAGSISTAGTFSCSGNATLGNASTDAHAISGAVTFAPGVQSYKFGNRSMAAYLQSQTSGVVAALGLHTADGDGTDALGISLWAKGTPLSYTVRENLNIEYDNTNRRYLVFSGAVGTGAVLLPIVLSAAGNATQLVLNTDNSVSMSGALTAASLTTAGASTVGSLTTDTLAGITTIAGSWYQDTAFACTLSRVGYTSTLSYNATHKDSIGTCRIVKTGANYNMYLYNFDAMVTASSFGLMYLKSVLPVAWRPNGTYSWMIGDNGGANFATGSYDPSSYRWMFSFETGYSMWLTAFATSYTQ